MENMQALMETELLEVALKTATQQKPDLQLKIVKSNKEAMASHSHDIDAN
ncbi:hypothetical protein [Chitinimonas arctica]|nr:hypothetical protein [Chitinimonas arctica]